MKKLCWVAMIAIFSVTTLKAQVNVSFGATGGLFYGTADLTAGGFDLGALSDDLDVLDGGGFFLGLLADIEILNSFSVQPEVLYATIGDESAIFIPIMAKYYVAESFNLQAGPQFDLVLDVPAIAEDLVNKFGLSMAIGAGFDFTEKLGVQAKYSFGLNNRLNDKVSELFEDFVVISPSLKTNILQAGIVYKF